MFEAPPADSFTMAGIAPAIRSTSSLDPKSARSVGALVVAFAGLTALQAASLFFLGVGHRTATTSLAAQTCEGLIVSICAVRAAFRSRRVGRVFWILIASSLAAWMIANGINFISECAGPVFAPLTITLVYRLYG